jgi:hypothetical protein
MFSDRLKKLIVEYLLKDLMPVEIIYYKDSIWFIDRERRYWYFEYHKEDKHLWWRWSHFQSALTMFSLNGEEHQYLFGELVNMILNKKQKLETKYPDKVFKTVGSIFNFKEGVEEVLNFEVNTTSVQYLSRFRRVDEVLNCEVKTTNYQESENVASVGEVLNCEVKKTLSGGAKKSMEAHKVLDHEVETINDIISGRPNQVDEILNHEVETTICGDSSLFGLVEDVLNHDVKTIGEAYHNDDYVTEEILNHNIDTIEINSIERMKGESPFQDIVVSHILDESEKVTDKLKIKEDDRVKSYSCDVFMCDFLVQNVLDIGSNSINFDVTSQQGRVDGVLKNS